MENLELKIYLKAKGLFIEKEKLNYLEMLILERAESGNFYRFRNFTYVQGGNHADDVAVVWVFARKISAKEGFDWAWMPDLDKYHFSIGFNPTPKGKELMKMADDYHEAQLKAFGYDLKVRNIVVG